MKSFVCLALSLMSFGLVAQVQSPSEFLGYELGSRFSRHADVVDYFKHVAENSAQVKFEEYGRTYENRPLMLAYVASDANMAKLEDIRKDNLRRTGIMNGNPTSNVTIVWLSYNVHGNEASSTEAAMATIYEILTLDEAQTWLENTVVIIDPCINPDGRDRYANYYNQFGNLPFNPDVQSVEHNEDWPGGRRNHYLFDLNRDWAWQTQIESQERIKEYNKWMPHVHVDFHEQGYNSPYYFAPAAEPLHEQITDWQREFQTTIGKNHARYFDKNNWFYFTKQWFDLLYPSYGDSYPMFNGGIGMTYEQAGHGLAGLGVTKMEGDTLTLLDRLTHHKTTGLSTIEITTKNNERVISEFEKFFDTPVKGKYKSFVLKYQNYDKFRHLKDWLDANGIAYGKASNQKGLKGYHYGSGIERSFTIESRDLVISTNQPKGVLAKVLFEPVTYVPDSVTYDITAWSVPYFYGLDAYATTTALSVSQDDSPDFMPSPLEDKPVYALLYSWKSLEDAKFLSALLKEGVKVRFAQKKIKSNGNTFDEGTLVIAKRDNKHMKDFANRVNAIGTAFGRRAYPVRTGFMDMAPDIGSRDVAYLEAPKIAMFFDEGTSLDGVGPTWHFMEQELKYPVSTIRVSEVNRADMDKYDVLIMQQGSYYNLEKSGLDKISDWVSDGGKLILFHSAIRKFADSDYASISKYNSDEEKSEMEGKAKERSEATKLARYEDGERNYVKNIIPGAIFKVKLDNSHPMAYGYGDDYYTLKTSSSRYGYLDSQNVGIIESKADHRNGFAGQHVLEDVGKSLVFGVENKGRGQIVYFVDNPLFRAFWYNGKLMVANALFFVGK